MAQPGTEIAAEDWSGEMGERWLANVDRFESMISPAGDALMQHARFAAGERVVDIGCGAGGTTIEIGRAVGESGSALGIDISPVLISEAERRARANGGWNVRFLVADAATVTPDGAPFDRLFSRFGSMFFADFGAAFANLRRMLSDGGRADLGVWAPPSENAWVAGMQEVLARHIELPRPAPHAPGPFALADPTSSSPCCWMPVSRRWSLSCGAASSWSAAPVQPQGRLPTSRSMPSRWATH